MKIQRII